MVLNSLTTSFLLETTLERVLESVRRISKSSDIMANAPHCFKNKGINCENVVGVHW